MEALCAALAQAEGSSGVRVAHQSPACGLQPTLQPDHARMLSAHRSGSRLGGGRCEPASYLVTRLFDTSETASGLHPAAVTAGDLAPGLITSYMRPEGKA